MLSEMIDHFIPVTMYKFTEACSRGDEDEVERLYEENPSVLNQQDFLGKTGLMWSVFGKHHSVSRWLLGRPGIDTAPTAESAETALHYACRCGAPLPLDVLAQLAELARWQGTLLST